jgi:hypothetical protein
MSEAKICRTCLRELEKRSFWVKQWYVKSDGERTPYYHADCKECERADERRRELHRKYSAAWAERNPEKRKESNKKQADKESNKKKKNERQRMKRVESGAIPRSTTDDEKRLDVETRLRAKHMRRLLRAKKRMQSPTIGMSPAERYRWKMKNDPAFVIHQRMRTSVKKALRVGKDGRRWEALVGYTREELAEHLKRMMPRGYSMEDLGKGRIHIDHIIPKSMFDVANIEELRACWALSNLRPVPAKINLRKGAKRTHLL